MENYYFVQKEAFFMIIKNKNSEAVKRIFCYFFKSKEEKELFNSGAKRVGFPFLVQVKIIQYNT